jgi:uncharacterized membrane protein
MLVFLKELYNGKLPLKEMLWMYGVLPILFIFLSDSLGIFSQKIGASITWIIAIFTFIAWSGIKKSTDDPLLNIIASIFRFILLIVIIFAGPMAIIFGFSGYQG